MMEFVVVVAEISDDDDKIDFENMDDDGYYYCQQLMMMMTGVVPLMDLIWINYLVDKAIKKRKKDIKFFFDVEKLF